ncbi:MAG: succinate dehydrogenase, cytochrome b556 subunit [Pseudomonadales bacterium]|nr:succinate dehydrogenase, cytochrome b556 subunit [Pseudomonadales bacterium]
MSDKRPVNLDIATIRLPLPAYVSILHRVSGVFLIAGFAVFLYLLDLSLSSPEGFAEAVACLDAPLVKFVVWVVVSAFLYHLFAGLKHLIMDVGIGETLEGGQTGAKITLVASALSIIAAGVWILW